jgi:hypothetical protein
MRHSRTDTRTAYHEAGHCLISLHLSVPVTSIGIERKASWNGYPYIQKKGWIRHGRGVTASLEDCILILLAGPMAEKMCPCGIGRSGDFYLTSLEDMTQVYETVDEVGFTGGARGRYMRQCRSRVETGLRYHWKQVEALANALLIRKRLTGKQAEKIAGEVWEKEKGKHLLTAHRKKKEG